MAKVRQWIITVSHDQSIHNIASGHQDGTPLALLDAGLNADPTTNGHGRRRARRERATSRRRRQALGGKRSRVSGEWRNSCLKCENSSFPGTADDLSLRTSSSFAVTLLRVGESWRLGQDL